jgi:hypothetical protein
MEDVSVELGLSELLLEDVQVVPLLPFFHRTRPSPHLLPLEKTIRDGGKGGGGPAGHATTRGARTHSPTVL